MWKRFYHNLASLEESDIGVRERLGKSLFQAITKSCTDLKKVHLKVKEFSGYSIAKVDWSFLEGIKRLQDFQISRSYCLNSKLNLMEMDQHFWRLFQGVKCRD